MWYARIWGAGVYDDSDKELAILDAKRYSAGEYGGTEVHLMHDGKHARTYYDGRLSETFEEDYSGTQEQAGTPARVV